MSSFDGIDPLTLELRVLTGPQAGARLILSDATYHIGEGDDNDVILAGLGTETGNAILTVMKGRIHLSQPPRTSGTDQTTLVEVDLQPGQPYRLGSVWLVIDAVDEPWLNLEQLEIGRAQLVQEDAKATRGSQGTTVFRIKRRRSRVLFVASVSILLLLGSGFTYALRVENSTQDAEKRLVSTPPEKEPKEQIGLLMDSVPGVQSNGGAEDTGTTQWLADPLSELRSNLRRAGLEAIVGLETNGKSIEFYGAPDADQTVKFEEVLIPFAKKYGKQFVIHANFGSPSTRLPFRVVQVMDGPNGFIVTDSGLRVFVGGYHQGVRVASIRGRRVKFDGKQALEIEL